MNRNWLGEKLHDLDIDPWFLMLVQNKAFTALRVGGVRCDFDGSDSIIQAE